MADLILGIEIGGTKLQLALGTMEGDLVATRQAKVNVRHGAEGIRQWFMEQVPGFIKKKAREFGKVIAIGCGFGGPIDRNLGKVQKSNQISGWQNYPLKDWFENAFKLPSWVENDSNAAAWGEYQKGFGRGTQHFFYTNLGSGVGGGFVFNGNLYDGQGFGAGEFGHTYVPDLVHYLPAHSIEIEQICSGWAIENRLRHPGYVPETADLFKRFKCNLVGITTHDLAESARAGDSFALAEIDRVAHAMGIGLANVLCLTNVERIAIGGGVSKMGDLLIKPIQHYTAQYAFVGNQGRYLIRQSELGDAVVLIGAILLAKQAVLNA